MSTKVSVLVEIPDGWELACDEMRVPQRGEWTMSSQGPLQIDYVTACRCVIVRKAWTWPEWLTAERLEVVGGVWRRVVNGGHYAMKGLDFTPPPDRTKVYYNPTRKEQ